MKIKFGTDGWRAIIAKEYTTEGVQRVAEASAKWMLKKKMSKVVIGHDCRFGGEMFLQTAAQVFANFGIKTLVAKDFVSTPMVSLGVVKTEADLGVVITASHNPPSYNGYKLKSSFGGPTIPKEIEEVEILIPDTPIGKLDPFDSFVERGIVEFIDLEQMYIDHVVKM